MLAVIETHPVQYHAPVYRLLQQSFQIPVTAIYGSDFSVMGYKDPEFEADFAWDTNLLSGYTSRFLSNVSHGGARAFGEASTRGLRQALRELAPRALLITGYSPSFNQFACFEAWSGGYPILFRGETTDTARSRNSMKAWLRDSVLRRVYRRFARLLYIGEQSYRHYKRLDCPEEKLVFSPYCVDRDAFRCDEVARRRLRASTRLSLGASAKEIVLLFCGKLNPRKGPDILLHAVKHLPAGVREKFLVAFVGGGAMLEELKRLAAQAPAVRAEFVGFRNQSELSPFYHAADMLVLPSIHSETWGLVVNEALHHGLPCVVSDAVGCAPDLIEPGGTGEVARSGDVQSLAVAIQRALILVNHPEIRARCRRRVGGYTVEKAAEGIAGAYREILCRVPAGATKQ